MSDSQSRPQRRGPAGPVVTKGLRWWLRIVLVVFGLLALCMFIYSILGVQLFTFVMRGDNLTDDRNFDTFGQAALLLFQVITGPKPDSDVRRS